MKKFTSKHPGCNSSFLDYSLPVMIQSGGEFNLHKFQVDSNNEKLQSQAIYINTCGKYCDISAMASRTLIVNPKEEQKKAYQVAYEAQDLLIKSMQTGEKIFQVYQQVKKFINEKNPNLGVHSNFGFGIGFNYKEEALTINATNQSIIKSGMTFHVRITLTNVHKDASRSVIAIGDTIMID